jgi:Protein of unknown function (DUF664)
MLICMDLPETHRAVDERGTLTEMLDYQRAVMVRKVSGLTREQALTRLEPSTLTLAGLLRHLTMVDIYWFVMVLEGKAMPEPWALGDWDSDPDWEMTSAIDFTLEEIIDEFEKTWRAVGSISAEMNLDHIGTRGDGTEISHRWVLVHLIEEYARHNGHADLIRESIDGSSGD